MAGRPRRGGRTARTRQGAHQGRFAGVGQSDLLRRCRAQACAEPDGGGRGARLRRDRGHQGELSEDRDVGPAGRCDPQRRGARRWLGSRARRACALRARRCRHSLRHARGDARPHSRCHGHHEDGAQARPSSPRSFFHLVEEQSCSGRARRSSSAGSMAWATASTSCRRRRGSGSRRIPMHSSRGTSATTACREARRIRRRLPARSAWRRRCC